MKKLTNYSTKTIKRLVLLASAAAAVAFATTASAQIVGVSFGNQTSGSAAYAGTGLLGESFTFDQDNTTNYGGGSIFTTPISLGGGITASVSQGTSIPGDGGGYVGYQAFGGNAANLFSSWIGINAAGYATVTLSGLVVGDTYNLAVYGGESGGGPSGITLSGAITGTLPGGANPTDLTAGINALEETSYVATGTSLSFTAVVAPNQGNYGDLSGVGIQDVTAAPEPTSTSLMIGGAGALVGLMMLRRRCA